MYRATTPTHTFTLPIQTSDCKDILVTYKQNNVILDKHMDDGTLPSGMTIDGKTITITLTQEETKQFSQNVATVQVRVLTFDGLAMASQKFKLYIENVLNDEELE